ncbi:hypothetical protein DL768_011624 [Monosporascus sp. mg162]|nr:hypothetical protein DL768_011624 [Monosporascus sp. mg162]
MHIRTCVPPTPFAPTDRSTTTAVKGNFHPMRAYVQHAPTDGSGAVIHVSSSSVHGPYMPNFSSCRASKAGATKLFELPAHENPALFVLRVHRGLIGGTIMHSEFAHTTEGLLYDDEALETFKHGSGANIGAAVASRFDKLGYQVALVSRQGSDGDAPTRTPEGYLKIRADLTDPEAYAGIYSSVREALGGVPSVVVFNAAGYTPAAEPGNMFSVPLDRFQRDFDLSVKGAFVAAREAYRLWSSESEANDGGAKRQFIMTGNKLPRSILPMPDVATLGLTKSASAFWIGLADKLYREKGFRFFVADQRVPGGGPTGIKPDAEAHAELFTRIVRDPEPWPFYITFVDGTKLEKFENGSWEE